MLVTPGPLVIEANTRGDALWLKDPAHRGGTAIATVWRLAEPERAEGNARVMAYASRMHELGLRTAGISGRADGREVIEAWRALLMEMEETS